MRNSTTYLQWLRLCKSRPCKFWIWLRDHFCASLSHDITKYLVIKILLMNFLWRSKLSAKDDSVGGNNHQSCCSRRNPCILCHVKMSLSVKSSFFFFHSFLFSLPLYLSWKAFLFPCQISYPPEASFKFHFCYFYFPGLSMGFFDSWV